MFTCGGTYLLVISSAIAWISRRSWNQLYTFPIKLFYLNTISKDFLKICSNLRGELVAQVKSAKNLKDEELNKIKDELSKNFNKKIKIEYQYDPGLLGGLIIKIGSIMIDNSLKNKLKKIKNSMIEA